MLRRIDRAVLDWRSTPEIVRGYRLADSRPFEDGASILAERLQDYGAIVIPAPLGAEADTIATSLLSRGCSAVVVPFGFPYDLPGITTVIDSPELSAIDLDSIPGVVSTCALAIAETGTIILESGLGQGRRALSLVPDTLLVVVASDQIVRGVPEAIALLSPTAPQTWVSGPSATSDIELVRVHGVHGPRTLIAILVGA
jgi:L-lactate dehydrogenase complex protein LldG